MSAEAIEQGRWTNYYRKKRYKQKLNENSRNSE